MVGAMAGSAHADQLTRPEPVRAQLIAETQSAQPGRPLSVALRLEMQEGWHTYWINPGDAGLATSIAWELSPGLHAGPLQWPLPERIETPPLVSFGYHGTVLLLSEVAVDPSVTLGTSLQLKADVAWVACQEICVKGGANLGLAMPVSAPTPAREPQWARAFDEARAAVPVSATGWQARAAQFGQDVALYLLPPNGVETSLSSAWFFPEEPGVIEAAAPQRLQRTEMGYTLLLKHSSFAAAAGSATLRGVLVAPDGWATPPAGSALRSRLDGGGSAGFGSARGWRIEIPVTVHAKHGET